MSQKLSNAGAIIREIHSDHTGNWSHPRTIGTITTLASIFIAFVLIYLEAYVRAGIIVPGLALVGTMLGAKTAETFASQNRAARERIAELQAEAEQSQKMYEHLGPVLTNHKGKQEHGKANGLRPRGTARSALPAEGPPEENSEITQA